MRQSKRERQERDTRPETLTNFSNWYDGCVMYIMYFLVAKHKNESCERAQSKSFDKCNELTTFPCTQQVFACGFELMRPQHFRFCGCQILFKWCGWLWFFLFLLPLFLQPQIYSHFTSPSIVNGKLWAKRVPLPTIRHIWCAR